MRYFEIIVEAKEIIDFRHEKSDEPFFGPEKENHIDPKDGFYFAYRGGKLVLSSTSNSSYSSKVVTGDSSIKNMIWNELDGLVVFSTKTITIQKLSVDNRMVQHHLSNIKELKHALSVLLKYGVDLDFKIKGVPPHVPKTVGDLLKTEDPTDQILKNKPPIMYHGTSMKRWKEIQRVGLAPGNAPDEYNDLIKNYSEHNIYLATTPKGASFYGKRQAAKDGDSQYVVLAITVPDPAKLLTDDHWNHIAFHTIVPDENDLDYRGNPKTVNVPKSKEELTKQGSEPQRLRRSGRELGEFAYRGRILPKHISLVSIGKIR